MTGNHRGHGTRLQVNPIACDGVGICGHLAPELVSFDSWGFPVVSARALVGRDLRSANAAVAACPRRALFLSARVPALPTSGRPSPGRPSPGPH